jgi:putative acetyltransferase
VRALLERHLDFARTTSPPGLSFALDLDGLQGPDIQFVSARDGGRLLGVGALKRLDDGHAEIKSMHTAEAARGRGIGAAVLDHLIELARSHDCTRVSLETGTMDEFVAARRLYASRGFEPCDPFGGYPVDPNSTCMTRLL